MTLPAVIVPVKSAGRKSRLSGFLAKTQREEFAKLLFVDVAGALQGAGLLPTTYVVSPDPAVLALASRLGSRTVAEPGDAGVNSAVAKGLDAISSQSHVLVIPADLPLLRASELRHIVAMASYGVDVGVSPSRAFDGTNALLFRKSSRPALSFDRDSFWNHLSASGKRGFSVGVCTEAGLMFDVDSPDDLRALAKSRSKRMSAEFARRALR